MLGLITFALNYWSSFRNLNVFNSCGISFSFYLHIVFKPTVYIIVFLCMCVLLCLCARLCAYMYLQARVYICEFQSGGEMEGERCSDGESGSGREREKERRVSNLTIKAQKVSLWRSWSMRNGTPAPIWSVCLYDLSQWCVSLSQENAINKQYIPNNKYK